jgi:hypothetical protein
MYRKICQIQRQALLNLYLLIAALAFLVTPTFAATYSLSPGGGSFGQGSTFTVQLKLDTQGQPIDTADIFMSFPKDLLDVAYINQSSTFQTAAEKSISNGGIHLSLATLDPNSGQLTVANGNVVVATIGFKSKSLGSTNVGIGSNSVALSHTDGSNKITGVTGGTYNIVPATPQPSAAPAKIVISDVQVTNIATNGATVSWKTDRKSDSTVGYGLDKDRYVSQATKADLTTDHSLTITNSIFLPGSIMHYQVVSKDSTGATGSSTDATAHLKGYTVKIILVDNSGAPLKNIKLTIHSDPVDSATNDQGEVTFTDVTPEKHVVSIHGQNFERSSEITVAMAPDISAVQTFKILVDATGLNQLSKNQNTRFLGIDYKYLLAGLGLLILIVVVLVIVTRRKNKTPPSDPSGGSSSNSVIEAIARPLPQNSNTERPTVFSS